MEDDLLLAGFMEELFSDLLFVLLSPFLALEKAASSIFFLVLEVLVDPEDLLGALSEFSPVEDSWEESEVTFLLRLDLEV